MVYILSFLNYVIFAFLKSWSRIQGPNFIILIKLCLSPFSFLHQNTRDLISYKQHKFSSGGWEDEGVGRFCLVRAHFLVHRYGLFFTVSSYSKKGEGALWSLVSKSTNLIHEGSALGTQTLRPQQTQVSSYLPFESGKVFYSLTISLLQVLSPESSLLTAVYLLVYHACFVLLSFGGREVIFIYLFPYLHVFLSFKQKGWPGELEVLIGKKVTKRLPLFWYLQFLNIY